MALTESNKIKAILSTQRKSLYFFCFFPRLGYVKMNSPTRNSYANFFHYYSLLLYCLLCSKWSNERGMLNGVESRLGANKNISPVAKVIIIAIECWIAWKINMSNRCVTIRQRRIWRKLMLIRFFRTDTYLDPYHVNVNRSSVYLCVNTSCFHYCINSVNTPSSKFWERYWIINA